MKKNLSKIYTIVVIIALVILGAWSAWDIYRMRTSNSEAARINVSDIKNQVESTFNNGISFKDKGFSEIVRNIFKENPDLELLTVFSHDEEVGIEFHYDRSEEVELLNLSETTPLSMKDLPEYKYNQLMKSKLTSQLSAQGRTGLEMDLIYEVVDRTSIYNILIRLLIVVVVLFFTTLFMIFSISRKGTYNDEEEDFSEDFGDENESEEDMSLDWDQSGFDESQDESPAEDNFDGLDDLSLDDEEFGDLDLNDTGGDFGDINLDSDSDDLSFDDVTDDFSGDISSELASDDSFDDMNFDLDDSESDMDFDLSDDSDDFNFDAVSDDSNLEENDIDDLSTELSLGDDEDISFDDMDFDSDIPEEEDLLAMDHELTPEAGVDDLDFDDIGDSFSDDQINEEENSPSLYSPKSGVGWESFIEERVNLELERSASEDQDLVMGLIQCDSLTEDNYKIFADQLKEDFNYPDLIFEYKDKGFALIVPRNDLDEAISTLEAFTGKEQEQYGEINVGISSRNGRLIQGSRIFMEAENALHKAIEDSEKNIVGFRSDPDKFRDFLSNK